MRHLLLAATMLVLALVATFGTASVLEGVAAARDNAAAREPFEVAGTAKLALQPAIAHERMTSLFR